MVIFLFSSVLFVALLAVAIYFWQKPANTSQSIELPPPPDPRGLFSDFSVNQLRTSTELKPPETAPEITEQLFTETIDALRDFQTSPNKNSTTKLLHTTALADDAKNYGRAIELVLLSWRDGSLSDMSAAELQSLINSQYWVLSSRTRTSGAGFVLKQTLSNANSELQTPNKSN